MPNYDYKCLACNHLFETFHAMSESPKLSCPACGATETQKQLGSGAGIVFKGSGFYVTDYKNKSQSSAEPKAKPKTENKTSTSGAK